MGRNEVEEFIDNFYTYAAECIDKCAYSHASAKADSMEAIRRFYHSGYCYHFACILKSTFNRGRLVWMAPFSHIAWEDTDGTVYDVEGKYKGEALYAIPEEYVGVHILGFKHCKFPGNHIDTKEELIKVVKTYCELSGEEYDPKIEDMFRDTGISDILILNQKDQTGAEREP